MDGRRVEKLHEIAYSSNVVTIGGNETDAGIIQIRADELKDGVKGLSGFGASDL